MEERITSSNRRGGDHLTALSQTNLRSGTYDAEGSDGLMALLERGDIRLVNAYRAFEFHRCPLTYAHVCSRMHIVLLSRTGVI